MAEKTQSKGDRGRRPYIAPDGSVHGSGAGAGGGNPGEDFDDDPAAGGGDMPYHGSKPIDQGETPKDRHQGTGS